MLYEVITPTPEEIQKGLKSNICRCTGYKKIESAVLEASEHLRNNEEVDLITTTGKLGEPQPKYGAYETAIGDRKFVADYYLDDMGFAALKFSDYPKAKVLKIDSSEAEKLEGVWKIYTAVITSYSIHYTKLYD